MWLENFFARAATAAAVLGRRRRRRGVTRNFNNPSLSRRGKKKLTKKKVARVEKDRENTDSNKFVAYVWKF